MTSAPQGPLGYWAFISYSSRDVGWAKWIQRSIEAYRIPGRLVSTPTPVGPAPKRLRPLFRDRSELPAHADLAGQVQAALERSAFLIVVCSPAAAASEWVDDEIRRFRAIHGDSRILAVIVEGQPNGDPECFPPALRYRDAAGARIRVEPIAADLRPHRDGRRLAKLKLVAGMLGVGLDELVHRDGQRRARQFAGLAAAAFIGMALMTALASAALLATAEARRQRSQAEGLITFMLTDLRKRLEPSGRLDLMDGIGAKALAYYAAQNPSNLDANSLGQRASALRLMGEIDRQRGHLDDALRAFEAASATTAELLARSPSNGQRVFDHAQSVYWVGYIAFQRGEYAKAEAAFGQYLALAQRLTHLDPARDDWRMEIGYAENDLGALYLIEGRTAEALTAFATSEAVWQALAARRPTDSDVALNLAQAHAWRADTFEKQGLLALARQERETQLALYHSLLERDPTLQDAKFGIIVAERAEARLSMLAGDRNAALDGYRRAASQVQALLAAQPDNMDLAEETAAAELDLGEALMAAGELGAAASHQALAATLTATALARDPTVKDWQAYRDRARLLSAALAGRLGDHADALRLDQTTLATLTAGPAVAINTDARWLIDRARLQTGDELAALGRDTEARTSWQAVVDDLSGPLERYEPRLLVLLSEADRRLGRRGADQLVSKRLADMAPGGRGPTR